MRTWMTGLLVPLLLACTAQPMRRGDSPPRAALFHYVGIHFLAVPVRINDTIEATFILDTGIGVNIISQALCRKISCQISGTASGKRMSGQEVSFPTTRVPALTFAGQRATDALAAVFDFEARNFGVDPSISGFLSLDFFRTTPFAIDYRRRTITLLDEASLQARRARGAVSPLRFSEEGPALDVFTPMRLEGGAVASVEIDTGSPALTLDERFLSLLGIPKSAPQVKVVTGSDETGFTYERYFAAEPVVIGVAAGDATYARPVRTMFQRIIHDGLIGDAYLKHFIVTFDLPRRELIWETP